ncbi:hypothetical protein ANCDUO_16839 [Ancylostoma duodenale]|uniref:Uncharacterized protein n=1 Tax=Ancylostoma duodenale TaxID=51022 RepID=A0A0C2G2C5_9BILA|nr:hypothetical protein ANCDUO_16839 [Ancylostoma duodenale]
MVHHSFTLDCTAMSVRRSHVASSSDDWEAVCSSHGEERIKNFDSELDRHMMQTITDVKYMIKKSKYTALSKSCPPQISEKQKSSAVMCCYGPI